MGYHLAMRIKATQITFLLVGDDTEWITKQDLELWTESLKKASSRKVESGNFNLQLVGLRTVTDETNGDAIKNVILNIPLPKSEINKPIRDAIFSLAAASPMDVSVDSYIIEADEFCKRNKVNLDGAYAVRADN